MKLSEKVKKKIEESKESEETEIEISDVFGDNEKESKITKSDTKKLAQESKKKKEKIKNNKKSSDEYPILILLWGEDGTSKSEQILKFEPQEGTMVLDLENKLKKLAEKLEFPEDNLIVASKYNKKYRIDGPKTLQGIRDFIEDIRTKIQKGDLSIKAIALDGVTDIRPYAVAEWLEENPDRTRPSTFGDWRDINDKVRDICFTLLNLGIAENINIFFTSQISHRDEKDMPNVKEWILHVIHHKFKMTRDDVNKRFYAYCEKSYFDPFFTLDLTDFTHKDIPSLMNILQDPKLVEKYRNEFFENQKKIVKEKVDNLF